MDIKVSIIVPAYNRGDKISGCIQSLIDQTLKEIEIIVVDDGSTDNTADVVSGFKDSRIKLIQTENRGQGLARNTGMDAARGDYIGFVDSDDDVSCDTYKAMYDAAIKYKADMVQCCTAFIKNNNVTVKPNLENEFVEITDCYEYVKKFLDTRKHTYGVCNKIFDAKFLRENNLRFPDTKKVYCEDLAFNLYTLEKLKRVYFMKDSFYNYNISDDGHFLGEPEKKLIQVCDLYDQTIDMIKNEKVKRAIKCDAADRILTFITVVVDTDTATKVLRSPSLKNYVLNMMLYEKTVRHSLFSIVFLLSPVRLRKRLLKIVYSRFI